MNWLTAQAKGLVTWAKELADAYRDLVTGRGVFGDHEAEPSDDPAYCITCRYRIVKDGNGWMHW